MRLRSPERLWRYLLGDLARLLALTTVSLVTVIAFAAAIKPLADGKIELVNAMKFMALAVIPMLQFALPFAAGFASTMTFHRFASENEATAAMAGGISHRTLLAPAIGLGVILASVVALLTNQIIPTFLQSMDQIIARSATSTITSTIERGQTLRLGPFDIHAKRVHAFGPDPATGAFAYLVLDDVLAAQNDRSGDIDLYVSANHVTALLFEEPDAQETASTSVQLVFDQATIVQDRADGTGSDILRQDRLYVQRIRIPGRFRDNPKFLTYRELIDLRRHPERLNKVDGLRRELATRIAEQQMLEEIEARFTTDKRMSLVNKQGDRLILEGAGLAPLGDGWRIRPLNPGQPVTMLWLLAGGGERLQRAGDVSLSLVRPTTDQRNAMWTSADEGEFTLTADRVATLDGRAATDDIDDAERRTLTYGSLRTIADHRAVELERSVDELLVRADAVAEYADPTVAARVTSTASRLRNQRDDLLREALSKLHERAAFALSCLFMVLTGAIVGFKMKDALPLPVYLWSFFPALFAVITISAGQNMAHRAGEAGYVLLWGGVGALGIFTFIEYLKLARH